GDLQIPHLSRPSQGSNMTHAGPSVGTTLTRTNRLPGEGGWGQGTRDPRDPEVGTSASILSEVYLHHLPKNVSWTLNMRPCLSSLLRRLLSKCPREAKNKRCVVGLRDVLRAYAAQRRCQDVSSWAGVGGSKWGGGG
ncbi:hypothetical protein BaRGS_00003063, partial [Batillaria attramentaria]